MVFDWSFSLLSWTHKFIYSSNIHLAPNMCWHYAIHDIKQWIRCLKSPTLLPYNQKDNHGFSVYCDKYCMRGKMKNLNAKDYSIFWRRWNPNHLCSPVFKLKFKSKLSFTCRITAGAHRQVEKSGWGIGLMFCWSLTWERAGKELCLSGWDQGLWMIAESLRRKLRVPQSLWRTCSQNLYTSRLMMLAAVSVSDSPSGLHKC